MSVPKGTVPKPPSTPRGGFVVIKRDGETGRLVASHRPYEHATAASACTEARLLASRHRAEFAVFHEMGSMNGGDNA